MSHLLFRGIMRKYQFYQYKYQFPICEKSKHMWTGLYFQVIKQVEYHYFFGANGSL